MYIIFNTCYAGKRLLLDEQQKTRFYATFKDTILLTTGGLVCARGQGHCLAGVGMGNMQQVKCKASGRRCYVVTRYNINAGCAIYPDEESQLY